MLARASRWSVRATVGPVSNSVICAAAAPLRSSTSIQASNKRLLTSSGTTSLPRQPLRRAVQQGKDVDEHPQASATTTSTTPYNISDELSGTDPSIPWFLQTETIDPPPPARDPATDTLTQLDTSTSTNTFSYIPIAPKVDEPKAIASLKSHLLSGPSANLIVRPSEEEDQLTPITLIHPASLSKDPGSDAYGTNDWIVVVQVKSSAAGSVRRVALDIGRFLKHTRPPAIEDQLDLDEFLGPGPSAPRYHQKPATPKPTTATDTAPATRRPKGMSRIEHELGKSLPDWAVHRIALKKKFPDGWRPPKILTREAQEGIRLLHSSDPEQFDVVALSHRFRISTESIRRILRSGRWAISGETRSRQDRRAVERAAERETSELAEIRRLQEEQSQLVQDGESPAIEQDPEATTAVEEEQELQEELKLQEELELQEDDGLPGIQPVRYEGLVMSASDASALRVTSKSKTGGKKGDGNWCLVDADWCMVHVMTEQARFNYDIEGIWRQLEVGKSTKPKPWQEVEFAGHPSASSSAAPTPSWPRTKRNLFGENLSRNRKRNNDDDTSTKFASSSTSFATSTRHYSTSTRTGKEMPESLSQLLARAQTTFDSGATDPIPVSVTGWLRSTRKQKSLTFLELSDGSLPGSRSLQAIVRSCKDSPSTDIDRLAGLTVGTALRLTGTLHPGRGTKRGQEVELSTTSIEALSPCDPSYPLAAVTMQHSHTAVQDSGYSASLSERRNPHLLGRLPRFAAVAKTRHRLEQGISDYLCKQDFVKVSCPVLTASDCEGAGEVFQVCSASDLTSAKKDGDWSAFWSGTKAYLTVSSQLHLEAAGLGLGRVWTMNPAFRAEGSATNRHLAEFWMVEAEIYFINLQAILDLTEAMLKHAVRAAMESGQEDLESLAGQKHLDILKQVVQAEWKRITYHQAHQLLGEAPANTFSIQPRVQDGLASEHERYLSALLGPVFVTHYPIGLKAFYMKRSGFPTASASASASSQEESLVECFDLLFPNLGELVGGSVREHRPEELEKNLNELRADDLKEKLAWYIQDLKQYGGSVQHAGFGMGLERLLAWVTGTLSVRDVVPFPRVKGPIRF